MNEISIIKSPSCSNNITMPLFCFNIVSQSFSVDSAGIRTAVTIGIVPTSIITRFLGWKGKSKQPTLFLDA